MTTEDEALRDAQKQAADIYLAGHLEKHDMEQERAAAALTHSMERQDDHRSRHEEAHTVHIAQHVQEQLAVSTALTAKGLRDDDHRVAHDRDHLGHISVHQQEQLAVSTALEAVSRERKIHADAHEREHLAHSQVHMDAQRAVDKAEAAIETRLHTMNEVRDQMRDQNASFVRLDAFETFKDERRQALSALDSSIDARMEGLRNLIATEREERRASEGTKKGISQSTAIVVGAIGLAATVISVIIVIMNFATGTA